LESIDLAVSLQGSEARLERFQGLLGGGEVRGSGAARFDGSGLASYDLKLNASRVRIQWPEWFEGVYDADLSLTGDSQSATLGGKVNVLRGLYLEQFDLAGVLGIGSREYTTGSPQELALLLGFDLDIVADGDVWVRNDLAQLELRCNLHLGGTVQRPELTGRFSIIGGGKFEFRNTKYRILAGHVDFAELERLAPYLFLNAQTSVGTYEILLRIEGTLERFDYHLSSNPHLSQQDIIALLATGRTLQELGARTTDSGADFTGDLAANYFAGALTGPFEKQLEKLLGLERVQINPALTDGSADATTRVTVGKEVSDDVIVIVSNEFGANPRQLYQVEWQATRKHFVTIQTDSRAGTGGTVSYTNRYWWKKRDAADQQAAGLAAAEGEDAEPTAIVGQASIEGIDAEQAAELTQKLPLKPGREFRASDVYAANETIRRFFIKRGRIQVAVQALVTDGLDPSTIDVVYRVDPGPRIEVVLEGVQGRDERRLRTRLEALWAESLFVEGLHADSTELIRRFFQERGYYAADVEHRVEHEGELWRFVVDRGSLVRVTGVQIVRAEQVPEERIRRQLLTRSASLFTRGRLDPAVLDDDLKAVRSLYIDQGHLDAVVHEPRIRLSAAADSAEIEIKIEEGPRFTIESVEFSPGLQFSNDELRDWAGMGAGDIYSPAALLRAESGLRAGIDRQGFPDSRARGAVERGDATVRVFFEVDPGVQQRVGEIVISGNLLTQDRVIRREMELETGELLSRERLLRGQHQLYRLGAFRGVRVTHEPIDPGDPALQRVKVRVEEAKPLGMNVGVGFDSERGPQANFATSHDNLFGHVRTLAIQLFLSDTLRRAQIVAREPRLFGYKLPALIDYSLEEREEVSYDLRRNSVAFRVDRRLSRNWTSFLRYNYQSQDLKEVTDPDVPREERLEDLRLGDVSGSLMLDLRDDPLLTTHGAHFQVGVRWFSQLFFSEGNFVKGTASANYTHTFSNRTTFSTSIRVSLGSPYGTTPDIPISERYFAGGQSTIRGFKLDEVGPKEDGLPTGGEGRLILNQEFRFPVWKRFRGVLFYDAGNVYRRIDDFDPFDVRNVLGLGVRFDAPFGPIRAEYGWKMGRREGETPGEFHFAIGAVF
jgi:outer membrane protein insertion porin family